MEDTKNILSLSREDLYEKIWAESATSIARFYSLPLSDVLKLCDTKQIPRPPSGYWSKVRHGIKVEKAPLGTFVESSNRQFRIRQKPLTLRKRIIEKPAKDFSAKIEKGSLPRHPLIAQTYKTFKNIRPDYSDRLKSNESSLHVYVGYRSLDRAMSIMNCLIHELEALGHAVRIEKDHNSKWITQVVVNGAAVSFHMEEGVEKRPLPLDTKKPWPIQNYEHICTGNLKFLIDDYLGDGQRKSWSDAKNSRLEGKIPSILEGLLQAGEILLKRQIENEKRKAEWREAELRRIEEDRRERLLRQEIEKLDTQSQAWGKAEKIRRFVHAYKVAVEEKVGAERAAALLGDWVAISLSRADAIDPIFLSLKRIENSNDQA